MQTESLTTHMRQSTGTHRMARKSSLLHQNTVPVDERGLPQLLATIREYAHNIYFYNRANKRDGTWHSLFQHNDVLMLSTVMSLQTGMMRDRFLQQKSLGQRSALNALRQLLDIYEHWFTWGRYSQHPKVKQVHIDSTHYFRDQLASTYESVVNVFATLLPSDRNQWPELSQMSLAGSEPSNVVAKTFLKWDHTERMSRLQECAEQLLQGLDLLQKEAEKAFYELAAMPVHEPAVGMLLAFLNTYKDVQSETNTFENRLLHFYYHQILKNTKELGQGDRVYLACSLQSGADQVHIPKGTLFNAGKTADLQPLLYKTLKNTLLTGAQLTAVKTQYFQRHNDISPENVSQAITVAQSCDVLAQTQKSNAVPLFGFQSGTNRAKHTEENDLSFVMASPVFEMKEGTRTVQFDFQFSDNAIDRLEAKRKKLQRQFDGSEKRSSLTENSRANGVAKAPTYELEAVRHSIEEVLLEVLPEFVSQSRHRREVVSNVCGDLDALLVDDWVNASVFPGVKLHRDCLIALYARERDLLCKGKLHAEIMTRRMFNSTYLSSKDFSKFATNIENLTIVNTSAQRKLRDMEDDVSRSTLANLVHYFQYAFEFHLSHEEGWHISRQYAVSPLPNTEFFGFQLTLQLDANAPAIVNANPAVHGEAHIKDKPAVLLRINQKSKRCPLSWFECWKLSRVRIEVDVQGYRDLCIQNDNGKLDASKTFQPFTSVPSANARLFVGGYEFAKKKLSNLSLSVCWNNLPNDVGGFSKYYQGYGQGLSNSDFKTRMTMLSHGRYFPIDPAQQQILPLFKWHRSTNVLDIDQEFSFRFAHDFPRISSTMSRLTYEQLSEHHHGYVCLSLNTGSSVFGHKEYPTRLSRVLMTNARRKRRFKPEPNEPYTPEISNITASYHAIDELDLVTNLTRLDEISRVENQASTGVAFHTNFLGRSLIRTDGERSISRLFPIQPEDGHLYIGYTPAKHSSMLCLYFELNKDTHPDGGEPTLPVTWRYYSRNGWKRLSDQAILRDTTDGFLSSGILSIRIPDDSQPHSGYRPQHQYWLQISTQEPHKFGTLRAITVNAIEVVSQDNLAKVSVHLQGRSQRWRAVNDITGLQAVEQPEKAFANDDSEDELNSEMRLSERLRHKNRAIQQWDYERLVLENYPGVSLTKCLPNTRFDVKSVCPGHTLIVIAPGVSNGTESLGEAHRASAVDLQSVQDYLTTLAPPTAIIDVVNATFEYIQVRCAVAYCDEALAGEYSKHLQHALSKYLSPWSNTGFRCGFSWTVQAKSVEAYIQSLSYVKTVARVSLVKCYDSDSIVDGYQLDDTALPQNKNQQLKAKYPWSLPLPAKLHDIERLAPDDHDYHADPVGISSLQIGNTFVVGGVK